MRYKCLLCGRDKFAKPHQPHKCVGGYRKSFKKAERNGNPCFVPVDASPSPEAALPKFIRIIVQVEARSENVPAVQEIANFAESRMTMVVGFKLVKVAREIVHAIETYGSTAPPYPRAKRQTPTPSAGT